MKQYQKWIIAFVAYIAAFSLSYFDTENRLWLVPFAVWVWGAYRALITLKPKVSNEIALLKCSTDNKDFICAFISAALFLAVLIALFVTGFSGTFRFDFWTDGGSFLDGIMTGWMAVLSYVLPVILLCLLWIPIGALLSFLFSDSEHASFGSTLFICTSKFLILSYICGIIDIQKTLSLLSSIWNRIMQ